ncbi:hypothetical protein J2Y66_000644 [Paenarthrobacter nitroguajacolicus]|uniref:hypothetical protein n=1 Tax=Paenarthrobacter nitroguajacolicus TaxID=211146 RepID=UPI00285CAA49|nr:hypothetical protein [Paenarthrobacter nitroguajacolicus]MDR6986181.1 hypothetical protein [Paenarthrobacter nitroguajacolicus]
MQKRYKLSGASLEAIRAKALQHYGPGARIVAAEKVTNPGIVGLFAAARFEATVEVAAVPGVPEASAAGPVSGPIHEFHGPAIAALLERADAAERDLYRPAPAPVSTASPDFAGLLDQLGKELQEAEAPLPAPVPLPPSNAVRVPQPLTGDGNLIVLLGLGDDALGPALEMSIAAGGSDVRTGGGLSAFGHLHVQGRKSATAARAQAVLTGQTVVVAFGLGRPRDVPDKGALIADLAADQLWIVADARRKPEDTRMWVQALQDVLARESTAVTGLAVIGASETASPETVDTLGIPVGWVDGRPATAPALGKVH